MACKRFRGFESLRLHRFLPATPVELAPHRIHAGRTRGRRGRLRRHHESASVSRRVAAEAVRVPSRDGDPRQASACRVAMLSRRRVHQRPATETDALGTNQQADGQFASRAPRRHHPARNPIPSALRQARPVRAMALGVQRIRSCPADALGARPVAVLRARMRPPGPRPRALSVALLPCDRLLTRPPG